MSEIGWQPLRTIGVTLAGSTVAGCFGSPVVDRRHREVNPYRHRHR
jgi:hypothetical protein